MNIAIIALTEQGLKTAQRIEAGLKPNPSIYVFKKITEETCLPESKVFDHITSFSEPLQQLINRIFKKFE